MRCTTAAVLATAVFCVVGMLTVCNMAQADWPTYRADASRSGYTPQELPEELSLRWVHRGAHRPQPAWPRSGRLPFDRAFQPVAAGGAVYFGSSVDGKVYALDAATGQIRWSRFTDGPIRFAPALWQDRLFVASDDGHLYALAADDGRLLWKRRGGPDHERRLGNQRMISKWPARGGPVVVDDVVYFGAGIWPSDGIFLYALDARSGEVLWQDDESGRLYMPQPHGGADAESGISAQGYLLVSGPEAPGAEAESQPPGLDDFRPGRYGPWLLVPTGRAVPAAFDRDSGKFEYFQESSFS